MEIVLLIARLALAAVFLVAGFAKLADRSATRLARRTFGLPDRLAAPLGVLLPLLEGVIALLLLSTATAWWGALGSLILLLLFMVAITANLARGRRPVCRCFGHVHAAPVGWPTLVRNGMLGLVAVVILWQGRTNAGASATGWLAALSAPALLGLLAVLLVAAAFVLVGSLILQVLHQNGRLLLRIEALEAAVVGGSAAAANGRQQSTGGLPVGSPSPAFRLPDLQGVLQSPATLLAAGQPVLLTFVDPSCGPCRALLPDIGRWQQTHAGQLIITVISRGRAEENRTVFTQQGVTPVLLQEEQEVIQSFGAVGTPSAVLLVSDGTIGSPVVHGAEQIRTLVARTVEGSQHAPVRVASSDGAHGRVGQRARPSVLPLGAPAPALALPDLSGNIVALGDLRGRDTLVVFWDPNCGYCQRLLPDLKRMELSRVEAAPQLLLVSTGPVEANQRMGLRARIVLDQGFSVGRAYGATGTPAAVLVDADGKIASGVVGGVTAVLALVEQGSAHSLVGN